MTSSKSFNVTLSMADFLKPVCWIIFFITFLYLNDSLDGNGILVQSIFSNALKLILYYLFSFNIVVKKCDAHFILFHFQLMCSFREFSEFFSLSVVFLNFILVCVSVGFSFSLLLEFYTPFQFEVIYLL